jgi:hypothetical protein
MTRHCLASTMADVGPFQVAQRFPGDAVVQIGELGNGSRKFARKVFPGNEQTDERRLEF